MRKIIALTIVAAALAVSACNTISGVGRDEQAVLAPYQRAGRIEQQRGAVEFDRCRHHTHWSLDQKWSGAI